jgi:hypothetical protein
LTPLWLIAGNATVFFKYVFRQQSNALLLQFVNAVLLYFSRKYFSGNHGLQRFLSDDFLHSTHRVDSVQGYAHTTTNSLNNEHPADKRKAIQYDGRRESAAP